MAYGFEETQTASNNKPKTPRVTFGYSTAWRSGNVFGLTNPEQQTSNSELRTNFKGKPKTEN